MVSIYKTLKQLYKTSNLNSNELIYESKYITTLCKTKTITDEEERKLQKILTKKIEILEKEAYKYRDDKPYNYF